MKNKYYLIDLDSEGNHGGILFWCPKGMGYTEDITKAGLFDEPTFTADTWSLTKSEIDKFKVVTMIPFYELSGLNTKVKKQEGTER